MKPMREKKMTKIIEMTGVTIDAAVESALKELNCTRDRVDVEVLNKGSKGIFGLGAIEAKVRVRVLEDDFNIDSIEASSDIESYILNILSKMGIEAELDVKEEEGNLNIEISGDMMGVVIGRRGDTLDALQYLTSLVYNKDKDDYVRVNLDTENYRAKREETLVNLAKKIAGTVSRTGRSITLEPMNPNERRIIHSALQEYRNITTYSTGKDPNRCIVITKKKKEYGEDYVSKYRYNRKENELEGV